MLKKSMIKRRTRINMRRDWSLRLILWLLISGINTEGSSGTQIKSGKVVLQADHQSIITTNQLENTWVNSLKSTTGTGSLKDNCFLMDGWRNCRTMKVLEITGKLRNRKKKMENGNNKQNISVISWNLGSKMWCRKKLEIEAVIIQYRPDVFIISESNLLESVSEEDRHIAGYRILLPKTSTVQNVSRLVMLVKEDLNYKLLDEYSDKEIAAVWIRIGSKGKKPMVVAGIYREHQFLNKEKPNPSGTDQEQLRRWNIFLDKWRKAARGQDVTVTGDTNLDFLKWGTQVLKSRKWWTELRL